MARPPKSSAVDEVNAREQMIYDFFKHLTTLNTASILLITGIAGQISASDLRGAYVAYCISLCTSLTMMLLMSFAVIQFTNLQNGFVGIIASAMILISVLGFVLGLWVTVETLQPGLFSPDGGKAKVENTEPT